MAAPIKILVIDDNPDDRQGIADHLSDVPGIKALPAPPPADMDSRPLLAHNADLVLVDYQLSGREQGRPTASYKGSTLAAVLREKLPDHPILLMTREQLVSAGKVAPTRDVAGAFDELTIKGAIYADPRQAGADFVRLVKGFRALSGARKDWNALRGVLGATREESVALHAAEPPEAVLRNEPWRVPEVARWIRLTLLKYPGVMYDALHAASVLGIDVRSYRRASIRRYFHAARYTGPFVSGYPVVWKGRFLNQARRLLRAAALHDEPLTSFAEAWRRKRGERLSPAICVWSRTSPADTVCYILQKPVMRRHSVPYRPDSRPAIMEQARVSFRAIRESDDYDPRLVAPDAHLLARAVERAADDAAVPA